MGLCANFFQAVRCSQRTHLGAQDQVKTAQIAFQKSSAEGIAYTGRILDVCGWEGWNFSQDLSILNHTAALLAQSDHSEIYGIQDRLCVQLAVFLQQLKLIFVGKQCMCADEPLAQAVGI